MESLGKDQKERRNDGVRALMSRTLGSVPVIQPFLCFLVAIRVDSRVPFPFSLCLNLVFGVVVKPCMVRESQGEWRREGKGLAFSFLGNTIGWSSISEQTSLSSLSPGSRIIRAPSLSSLLLPP